TIEEEVIAYEHYDRTALLENAMFVMIPDWGNFHLSVCGLMGLEMALELYCTFARFAVLWMRNGSGVICGGVPAKMN
ncbi:hypothetical protein E4U55_001950, partial [Claviceps digitariae]